VKPKKDHLKLVSDSGRKPAWKKAIRFLFNLVVIVALILLLKNADAYFRINKIDFEGLGDLTATQISEAGGIRKGMSIFLLQEQKIAEDIMRQFPQVKSVAVSRNLPDSVVVILTARIAAGYILTADGYYLIDRDGVCFATALEPVEGYPLILGIEGDMVIPGAPLACPIRREVLQKYFAYWPGDTGLEAAEINLNESYNLIVHTVDGLQIWFGDGRDMETKLALVQQSLPHIVADPETYLDVRSGKRLVVSKNAVNLEKEVEP
jgi:cell division septal protein FtsQ